MKPLVDRFEPRPVHMGVALRRADIRVPEQLLNRAQIRAALQEVRGE